MAGDINAISDFNTYDSDEYKALATTATGEFFRENYLLIQFGVALIILLLIGMFIYYFLVIIKK